MEITWYGHSCFLLKDSNGRKLLTDPFDPSVGYPMPNETVDIVTVSHQHFDHNYTKALPGIPNIIDKPGDYVVNDLAIKGIPSFHDKYNGAKRGDNIIFIIKMDGLSICHMGDLGHELTEETATQIGVIDVLLIPVGGNYTIDGEEAAQIAKKLNSHIVIPMHYGTNSLSFILDGADKFIVKMGNSERIGSCSLNLNKVSNTFNSVKILDYKSK